MLNLNQLLESTKPSSVVLVDLSNMMLIYHNAYRNLSIDLANGSFVPTGSFYGLTNLTERILKSQPNSLIFFCIDDGDSGRKSVYPKYKSNRVQSPEKQCIFSYKDKIQSILSVVPSVYFCQSQGMEADDVMSCLAFQIKEKGIDPVVYSRDYDFAQLIHYGISVSQKIEHGRFEFLTEDILLERYGVTSGLLLHYRVLEGDDSDNIPKPVKNVKRSFKIKLVHLWKENGFNKALDILSGIHLNETTKFNKPEIREQIRTNIKLMDLCKYRKPENRFEINIFKNKEMLSGDFISEYKLKQYENFLKFHYNVDYKLNK